MITNGRRESGRGSFVRESFLSVGEPTDGMSQQSAELSEQDIADIVNSPQRFNAEQIKEINDAEHRQSFGSSREKSVQFRSQYSSYTNFAD